MLTTECTSLCDIATIKIARRRLNLVFKKNCHQKRCKDQLNKEKERNNYIILTKLTRIDNRT